MFDPRKGEINLKGSMVFNSRGLWNICLNLVDCAGKRSFCLANCAVLELKNPSW